MVGAGEGVLSASAIRRVGAHRRRDPEGLAEIRGVPWVVIQIPRYMLEVAGRFLTDEEKQRGLSDIHTGENHFNRVQLRREVFLTHGYTEGFPGSRAALSGASRQGHSLLRRSRMEALIQSPAAASACVSLQEEKEPTKLARKTRDDVEKEKKRSPTPPSAGVDSKRGRSPIGGIAPASSRFPHLVGSSTGKTSADHRTPGAER